MTNQDKQVSVGTQRRFGAVVGVVGGLLGSFDKQRWFVQLGAVVALVGGLVAIAGGIAKFFEAKPPKQAADNTEIVLDHSHAMHGYLVQDPSKKKLDVAQDAVARILGRERGNLAFRAFGRRLQCHSTCTAGFFRRGQRQPNSARDQERRLSGGESSSARGGA